jgi:hypothetical protein
VVFLQQRSALARGAGIHVLSLAPTGQAIEKLELDDLPGIG